MGRETEKAAPSVEEAVEAALQDLGVSEQEAVIEVVQEPGAGQGAVVRVRAVAEPPDMDALEDQADAVADFLEELLGRMEIDAVAEPEIHGEHMYVDIVGDDEDDLALLIGRHGQTLDAIQELSRMIVGRRLDDRIRVIVDVEGYRRRRESKLVAMAEEAGRRVLRTGREVALEPMNPFERKLVHDAIARLGGLETSSSGEEPGRHVVIRKR